MKTKIYYLAVFIISIFTIGFLNTKTLNLSSADPDWVVVCDQEISRYGDGVSSGDINGDGYDDIVVGAPAYEPGGAVFIYYSSSSGPSIIPDKIIYGEGIGFGNRVCCNGDINNDGYYDVIISDPFHEGGRVFLYKGSITGISDSADWISDFTNLNSFNFGYEIASGGDVNGDGYDDLIANVLNTYLDSHYVGALVYLGSASGFSNDCPSWSASVIDLPEGNFGFSVSISGDVNADGYDDAVVSSPDYGKVFLYYGKANRQMFEPPERILYKSTYDFGNLAAIVKDVNSDGFDEIIIGDRQPDQSSVYVYFGSSTGPSDNYNWIYSAAPNCFGYLACSAGDFNNDGYNDIIVSNCEMPGGNIFFGSETGIFNIPLQLNGLCYKLASGDVNGDGFSDAILSREPKAYGFYGHPETPAISTFIQSVTPEMHSVSVDKSANIEVVFRQNMDASTLTPSNIKLYAGLSGIVPVSLNYNPGTKTLIIDPQIDFRAGEKVFVTLTSNINTSGDSQITPYTFTFNVAATGGTARFHISDSIDISGNARIGDIDADGDIDIAVGHSGNGIKIYKNDGSGHFIYFSDVAGASSSFELEDFDADGDMDIASAGDNNSIQLFKNNGFGNFTPSAISTGLLGKAGDFDGNGYPDMAAFSSGFDITFTMNDNGHFSLGNTVVSDFSCFYNMYRYGDFKIEDLDNDGKLDVIEIILLEYDVLNMWTGCKGIEFIRNNGTGNFTKSTIFSESYRVGYEGEIFDRANLLIFNFENDNDLDMLLYNKKMTNLGNVSFNVQSSGLMLEDPEFADFDGDGDLDYTFSLFWHYPKQRLFYLNDGHGNFTHSENLNSPDNSEILQLADFDGDGDIDQLIKKNGKLMISSNENCFISGPSNIAVFSQPVVYTVPSAFGYWTLSNFDLTQAAIVSGITDDTVLVDPGGVRGHFVLYYKDNNTIFCEKHVYVDDPLPVKLASFTSLVNGRNVTLNWETVNEENNSGFDVERRDISSGIQNVWSNIGYVNGSGTITESVNYSFTDKNLSTGKYNYRLKQIDFNGNFEYFELTGEVSIGIPDMYELSQNYPNPFNPVTTINYAIPKDGIVNIKIYDILGREVKTLLNEMKTAGYYKLQFNASDFASGAYFYRMSAGDYTAVKKFVVMK